MRFGIFYEHQMPRPWEEGQEGKLLTDALDQIELADRLGFDYVWEVEHHFLEEYSHSSASDVFLAAASQRTRDIRLGFGILPLPPGYQHPARVAETVATLDLISGGRVDFGTGETSSGMELEGFGVDRETKREQWSEALDVITRMMVEEPFAGWDGTYFSMPQRNVIPKPAQKPHPPLWVACSRRETILTAAEKGIGALTFAFVEPEEAAEWVQEYRAIINSSRCRPGGYAVNPRIAVVTPMMCHEDEETAIERGIDGAHFFAYALAHYYVFGEHRPGATSIWDEFLERREGAGFSRRIIRPEGEPLGVKLLREGFGSLRGAVGTPDQIRDLCRRYEAAGVDQLIFVSQAGPNKHEHICESMSLFGREVLPEFAERAEAAERAVDASLADAVAAALERREPPRKAESGYVVMPGAGGRGAPSTNGTAGPAAAPARVGGVTGSDNGAGRRSRGLAHALQRRGEAGLNAFVKRSPDMRLERTLGSGPGLRIIFNGMASRFVPDKAGGFEGDIVYELTPASGEVRRWTISIGGGRASVRPGGSDAAKLTLGLSLSDFVRLIGGDLHPGRALIENRLRVDGNLELAGRLGEMFGEPSGF